MNPIGFPGWIGWFWEGKLGRRCNHIMGHVTAHHTKKGWKGRHKPLLFPSHSILRTSLGWAHRSALLTQVLPAITSAHSQTSDYIMGHCWEKTEVDIKSNSHKPFLPGERCMLCLERCKLLRSLASSWSLLTSFSMVWFSLGLIKALSWDQGYSGGRQKGSNCIKVQKQT